MTLPLPLQPYDDVPDASLTVSSLLPRLKINLQQIKRNYLDLCAYAGPTEVSAVAKADCYGVGLEPVAKTLYNAGCKTFWVAYPSEAVPLRAIAKDAVIYVLHGVDEETLPLFRTLTLRPVLATMDQFRLWKEDGKNLEPAALHVETGLNRMAIPKECLPEIASAWKQGTVRLSLIMGHLACADTPSHPLNEKQRLAFEEARNLFPDLPASLSASYGLICLGKKYAYDVVRAGRALYGFSDQTPSLLLKTKPALTLSAVVTANATIDAGESVGYGATWTAQRKTRLATLSIGYADGVPFLLSKNGGHIYFESEGKTYAAPLVGRISMDLLTCDVTDLPASIATPSTEGFLISADHYIDEMAARSNVIDYQILTTLGNRFERSYS